MLHTQPANPMASSHSADLSISLAVPPSVPPLGHHSVQTSWHSSSIPRHTGRRSSVWPCFICSESYSTKRELTQHMSVEHGTKQEIRCPVCRKLFSNAANMKCHLVSHTGQYRFNCHLCGKQFATKENYTGHMNVHAGAKPFQCDKCLKCFAYKNHLSAHRKICISH